MRSLLFVLLLGGALITCSKDRFTTKPQIEIDSYNTKELQVRQDLVILLNFRDKEGDLPGGKFIFYPRRTNRRPPPFGVEYPDSVVTNIISFPNNDDGEFEFRLNWINLSLGGNENDSLFFRFAVEDAAGNRSDTIQSDNIVILRQ